MKVVGRVREEQNQAFLFSWLSACKELVQESQEMMSGTCFKIIRGGPGGVTDDLRLLSW